MDAANAVSATRQLAPGCDDLTPWSSADRPERNSSRFTKHDRRSLMQIERSHLENVLRQKGSEQTARTVEQRLPEHIDTQRDRQLIKECGIDPNVLETIVTQTLT